MTTHRDLTTPEEARKALESYAEHGKPYPSNADLARAAAIVPQDQFATPVPRTFTAAEVAEAFAGLEAKWRERSAQYAFHGVAHKLEATDACADELHERITHWLRENEG